MKKITAGLLAFLMLTGCSNIDNDQTLFVANNKGKYALMDYEGDKQTEFIYDKYEEVGSSGYIVIKDKKYGYLLRDGEEAIKLGKYDKLESIGNMIVGYDKNYTRKIKRQRFLYSGYRLFIKVKNILFYIMMVRY